MVSVGFAVDGQVVVVSQELEDVGGGVGAEALEAEQGVAEFVGLAIGVLEPVGVESAGVEGSCELDDAGGSVADLATALEGVGS